MRLKQVEINDFGLQSPLGSAIHRLGQKFDHGCVSAKWRWRTKRTKKTRRSDFSVMTSQSWPQFDEALRIKLQQHNEPRAQTPNRMEVVETVETDEDDSELDNVYANLTECVYATIKEVVSEKKWLKKNGRVVSQVAKDLFEKRTKEYKRVNPTREQRKKWNVRIRNVCRTDYRTWVAKWVETIESADNKGDAKTIYRGVKALGGSAAFERTNPTEHITRKKKNLNTTNESRSSGCRW